MAKRKCKVCGTVFEKQRPLQFVCSPACGIEYRRAQLRKAAVKSEREKEYEGGLPAGLVVTLARGKDKDEERLEHVFVYP